MDIPILFVCKDSASMECAAEKRGLCPDGIFCVNPCDVRMAFIATNYMFAVVRLPPDHGEEIDAIRWIHIHKSVPIVAFSSSPSKDEEILVLDAGADQYWGKPFDDDIIRAHMRALRRRYEKDRTFFKQDPDVLLFECGLSINLSLRIAFWKGKSLNLRPTPMAILVVLASHIGEVVAKEVLCEKISSGNYNVYADEILKHHISQLRKSLRLCGADELIETVWGVGYRLKKEILRE